MKETFKYSSLPGALIRCEERTIVTTPELESIIRSLHIPQDCSILFTHPSTVKHFVECSSQGQLTVLPIDDHGERIPYKFKDPSQEKIHSFYDLLLNRPYGRGQELVGKINLPLSVHNFCGINKCLEQALRSHPSLEVQWLREYGVNGSTSSSIFGYRLADQPLFGYLQGELVPKYVAPRVQSPFYCF